MAEDSKQADGASREAEETMPAGIEWIGLHDAAGLLGECCRLAWEPLGLARKTRRGRGRSGWEIRADANPVLAAIVAKLVAEWEDACDAAAARATAEFLSSKKAQGIKIGADTLRQWQAELSDKAGKAGLSKTA